MARHTAMAFHDPNRLDREADAFQRRAGIVLPVEEAFRTARATVARMKDAKHGR